MKYIVNNKEVSRDTFYFCKGAKEEHKTFVLLNPNNDVQTNINCHPEYDYFIYDEMRTYYTKNGWEYKSETKYPKESHDIPPAGDFEDEGVKIKLFSVKVKSEDTVMTINDLRKRYGDLGGDSCIKYVLRDNAYTEIIYRDAYKELEE